MNGLMANKQASSLCSLALALLPSTAAYTHPHVFIDGGLGFIVDRDNQLVALEVTWRFDPFETLYILSGYGLVLNADGGLNAADLETLGQQRNQWPSDFDGSAHLSLRGDPVPLNWPNDLTVDVIGGRLEQTFLRQLQTPLDITEQGIEVAFYESTYFFDFTVTEATKFIGTDICTATVVPFEADPNDADLLSQLAQLSREETPSTDRVGANFADRIQVKCV